MTVTHVDKDPAALTMTLVSEFDAPVHRAWQLWSDPRQLERWWGPPTWPATFVDHDLTPGGWVSYFMTGPEGDRAHGWWRIRAVDEHRSIEFEDGFADESGAPNPELPVMTILVTFEARAEGGTRMALRVEFPSRDAMDQVLTMGMEEGLTLALGQTDAVLAAGAPAS